MSYATELTDMHARLVAALDKRGWYINHPNKRRADNALESGGDLTLMKLYLLHVEAGFENLLYPMGLYGDLLNEGVDHPEQYVTVETTTIYVGLWEAIANLRTRTSFATNSSSVVSAAIMSGEKNVELMEKLINERSPLTGDEFLTILRQAQGIGTSLSSGVL